MLEPLPAGPADLERGGILFAAGGAANRRAGGGRAQVFVDDGAGAVRVPGILDPDLRERRVDRQLPREARGVRIEDARANAPVREPIGEEVRLRQIGCGVDLLQNLYESTAPAPHSLVPERPEML